MNRGKFSVGGMIAAVITLMTLGTASGSPPATASAAGAACALLIRSCFPPLTFGRGVATWFGGASLGYAVLAAWFLTTSIGRDRPGFGIGESVAVLILMAPMAFVLLRYGSVQVRPDPADVAQAALRTAAEAALRRACKLEADGDVQEAAAAYRAIISTFGDSSVSRDAESCLKAMDQASKENPTHPRD